MWRGRRCRLCSRGCGAVDRSAGSDAGDGSVVIDGVELGTVDTYWPSYVDQQVLFAAGGLGSGDHVLTITWEGLNPSAPAGSYVVVDAIEAAGSPVLSRFEESDGGFGLGRVGVRG